MLEFSRGANRTDSTWDENIFQGETPSCAVRSQQIIMRDYGIQIPQEELMKYAEDKGWYDADPVNGGTMTKDIGNLLEVCGIQTHTSYDTSIYDLVKELESGHRVIVSVDARELWAEPGSEEWQFYQNIKDPNHALVVAGARIDPLHPENSTVILTDPGRGDAFIEYKMNHFVQAWHDSDFFMMATDMAAPYQYNELLNKMEFSNFATEYTISEFPFHNTFTDICDLEINSYTPFYEDGCLNYVAEGISHDEFLRHWEDNDLESLEDMFALDELPNNYQRIEFTNDDIGEIQEIDDADFLQLDNDINTEF